MFYNQISLKGFSNFSIKSLAFSIASVIPALPKPFIAIPCHLSECCTDRQFPLLLKFSCSEQKTFENRKNFVDSLYGYDYNGVSDEESSNKEEAAIVIETDQSKPVSHTAADQSKPVSHTGADQSKLVSYTGSSSEEEEDLHVDVNQLTWPLINFLILK